MNNRGQLLVEIMLAMGLMTIMLPALLTGFVATREGKPVRESRTMAVQYLREAEEALRSVREKGWSYVNTSGLYYPQTNGTTWSLVSGTETIDTNFSRQILLEDVQRDTNGAIVPSGGKQDKSTKKATITVFWTKPRNDYVQSVVYLTRFVSNNTKTHTTTSDFSSGTFSNTETTGIGDGAVRLTLGITSSQTTDDYTTASYYTYNNTKIEVTGGYAQLKSIVSASNPGATLNPTFDSNITNWTSTTYGQNISAALARIASGGNPNGYAQINFPAKRNLTGGAYYRQTFVIGSTGVAATLSFDWRVLTYTNVPDALTVNVYIDTVATGTPTNLVWSSGTIVSTSPWSSVINLNVSSFVATAGTKYLKIGAYVDHTNSANSGPYTIGYDNVLLSWNNPVSGYPADSPSIYPNSSVQPSGLTAWTGFSEVAVKNGGSINYQLSNDDGSTWKYYSGGWVNANTAQYNSASVINSNIGTFSTANGKIRAKAFLTGSGTQQVKLDSITYTYQMSGGANSGNYISPSMDGTTDVAWNRLVWTESNTANTTTRLQVSTNSDNSTWSYVGPDGTAGTYFTSGSGPIPLDYIYGRYLRYKIYFTSTNSDQPNVSNVVVNYSP